MFTGGALFLTILLLYNACIGLMVVVLIVCAIHNEIEMLCAMGIVVSVCVCMCIAYCIVYVHNPTW